MLTYAGMTSSARAGEEFPDGGTDQDQRGGPGGVGGEGGSGGGGGGRHQQHIGRVHERGGGIKKVRPAY